jgi:hypothetical protein
LPLIWILLSAHAARLRSNVAITKERMESVADDN